MQNISVKNDFLKLLAEAGKDLNNCRFQSLIPDIKDIETDDTGISLIEFVTEGYTAKDYSNNNGDVPIVVWIKRDVFNSIKNKLK